jgi:hypothetical protein
MLALQGFRKFEPIPLIATVAALLVGTLALLAFILSYSSLQHLAATNGFGPLLSYLWPLLLDFAMIVFSLAILRANLRREAAWYPWTLTTIFAGLATLGNVLDVTGLGLPPILIAAGVKALAPVALVLAFELLMQMVKAELKRAAVVDSAADLTTRRDSLSADLERRQAEAAATITGLSRDIDELTARRAALQAELEALRRQKRRETKTPPTEVGEPTRLKAIEILTERPDLSGGELGRLLGRSDSLGRKLRRELLPIITAGANGSDPAAPADISNPAGTD